MTVDRKLDETALSAALNEADMWDEGFTSSPREYQVLRIGDTAVETVSTHDGRGPMEADLKRRRMAAAITAYFDALSATEAQAEPVGWIDPAQLAEHSRSNAALTNVSLLTKDWADATCPAAVPLYVSPHTGNGGVEVKPLEWVGDGWPKVANTMGGRFQYSIWADFEVTGNGYPVQCDGRSLDSAKAAAQSDYETRIRAALVRP